MDVTTLSADSVEVLELSASSGALVIKRLSCDEISQMSESLTV